MAINLTFINAALTRTGNDPVTELNDGTSGGNIAGQNYEQIVTAALTSYPWRWATTTKALAQITGTPDPPWTYAYTLPTDVLLLRVVTVDGYPIDYEQQYNKLLVDADNSSTDVIVKYTWRVPESNWPPDFAEAVTQHLEALFLRGVGERFQEAEARQKDAMRTLQAAKTADAKRASSTNPWRSPTLSARGGIDRWNWRDLHWRWG